MEGVVVDQVFFQMLDMSIRSGDIRDQSRKLSEIATKFGRYFGPPKFLGAFQKLYASYRPCLVARRLEKFHEDTPTSPEVIEAHTLNFKPHFSFSRLKFLGTLVPVRVCARLTWSICSAFKNFMAQHPLMTET